MTDDPIDLGGRRAAVERHRTEMRRRANAPSGAPSEQPQPGRLEGQRFAVPARTWREVIENWRFLRDRFSETPDADDECIQRRIKRAIGDMERLRKREKRK
ncbi:hypothetical protein [Defluviimonas sp. WL0075]|uniref:Uncharacterized protein n=1 Tax=Albidovulum sediminicola TaxID=2984331 RepID=A0ABT2Z794_9RHOB|nr:hypothetical protein [Defluviimonas sp. WL0075]MCV2866945.1 hypothetical protein [Defluviimonas sp. WL0075]